MSDEHRPINWNEVGGRLASARQRVGYKQEELAALLGVKREQVSYWETGARRPTDLQLEHLARACGVGLAWLLGEGTEPPSPQLELILFRQSSDQIEPQARQGLLDFLSFLDTYADLLEDTDGTIPGRSLSPWLLTKGYTSKDDVRRKAEEVRTSLGLGLAPIPNLRVLLEREGVVVYFAPLGRDLGSTISGAFVNHPRMGFSILVNSNQTSGRRTFTMAHEYAHALFHSHEFSALISFVSDRQEREAFADTFAGEFLVPSEALRRIFESLGLPKKIVDPHLVVWIQRYFAVSYLTMLVRLRQEGYVTYDTYQDLSQVKPVLLAQSMGYEIPEDEWCLERPPTLDQRYPLRFLETVHRGVQQNRISPMSAADLCRVSVDEIMDFLSSRRSASLAQLREADEFAPVFERK